MRHRTRLSRAAALVLLVLVTSALRLTVFAQGPVPPRPLTFASDAALPLDTAIKTGTLSNGLKFYIRKNALPEKRISLRLAVKAGSLEEADDQLGLAHFIEHM